MARPTKDEKDKRLVQVNIRLTIDEHQKVSHFASASGLTPANWIRKKIFTGKFPPVKMSPIEASTYQELKKIGVNLNQATHKLNLGENGAEYLMTLWRTKQKLDEILKLLVHDRQSG